MRIAVRFLLAAIPLSASSINLNATTGGSNSVSCGDSTTYGGFSVAAYAWSAPGGCSSDATASFNEDLVFTFFGGTGPGFAQPLLALSISDQFGSGAAATASLGGCLVPADGYCSWNSMPFVFGVPETWTLSLYAYAAAFGEMYESTSAGGEASYNGFLGFCDVNGDPLSGVTYEIAPVGQSTPEPATWLLTAMAGAALLACSRRR